ncbi:hypothetical protein C2857_005306 [Epichloe festucae Fl1]|uniref:Glycoside hydrolase subgroup catalytic core protein n=1 Tax=Epichloe festucae (strain Fl1) TaxID=877507 RepID=A0A7S9KPG5_EPIFF|nr:hypothetical protein C2857_005306 [Epichloe festucae Fl1]
MGFITALTLLISLAAAQETGNHPEWPRWCGKAYQPQYPSFEPGGQTVEPAPLPDGPALNIQLKPRYSIYLESEKQADFIVNANLSRWHGQKWSRLTGPSPPPVVFTIKLVSSNDVLVSSRVNVGTAGTLFAFNLTRLRPRFEPYQVVLFGATPDGASNVTATSEVVFLPEKKTGSVTKLDNLHGGILFRSAATGGVFEPFLPIGYYASCDGFLCDRDYASKDSRGVYSYMDGLGLRYMYDLRGSYKNLSAVREQVSEIRDFDGLYSYWGADEPDGHQDPFDLLPQARDAIRQLDPYHPVSVTLNCQDFHFKEYTAGADFIMEDAYPVAINGTFSKWGTACNATYGDCGCDNCRGGVQDVSDRLDGLARHEQWLGLWPKTKAHNPQAFHGEGYWLRDPTDEEEVAMVALALHHGAKAIAAWLWPFSDSLGRVMGRFGAAVSRDPVRDLVVTARAVRVGAAGAHEAAVDAACWVGEGRVLVSVVNAGQDAIDGEVSVSLPEGVVVKSREAVVWGSGTWTLDHGRVRLSGQSGMATNIVLLGV